MFVIEKLREREQGRPLSGYSCRQGGADRLARQAMTLTNISHSSHCTLSHRQAADSLISCYYITPNTTTTTRITATTEDISDLCFISSEEQQTVMGAGSLVQPATPMISYHVTKEGNSHSHGRLVCEREFID